MYRVGQDVLVRWSDRKLYFCKVVARPNRREARYCIEFDDQTRDFATSDMLHDADATYADVPCSVCTVKEDLDSVKNRLLVCGRCALGFHQRCHNPIVRGVVPDTWACRLCVELPDEIHGIEDQVLVDQDSDDGEHATRSNTSDTRRKRRRTHHDDDHDDDGKRTDQPFNVVKHEIGLNVKQVCTIQVNVIFSCLVLQDEVIAVKKRGRKPKPKLVAVEEPLAEAHAVDIDNDYTEDKVTTDAKQFAHTVVQDSTPELANDDHAAAVQGQPTAAELNGLAPSANNSDSVSASDEGSSQLVPEQSTSAPVEPSRGANSANDSSMTQQISRVSFVSSARLVSSLRNDSQLQLVPPPHFRQVDASLSNAQPEVFGVHLQCMFLTFAFTESFFGKASFDASKYF